MSIENALKRRIGKIKQGLLKGANRLENKMHEIVAIDTGKLNRSISTGKVMHGIGSIFIEVGSEDVKYAKFVEDARSIKNYHRHKKVVYTGAGQKWAKRSLEKTKSNIILDISKALHG